MQNQTAQRTETAIIDLNRMEVVRIEDDGVIPLPPEPGNYSGEAVGKMRTDLKPVEIIQPEGPSFTVRGHEVAWQKWRFRIGFTPREGLVLSRSKDFTRRRIKLW